MILVSKTYVGILIFSLLLFLNSGCGKQAEPRKKEATLDTPAHHTLRGQDMIAADQWDEARREFRLALELSADYSPALAGNAIVVAHDVQKAGRSEKERDHDAGSAKTLIDDAVSKAQNPKEEANAHTAAIRVWTLIQMGSWLNEAKDHFEEGTALYEKNSDLNNYRAAPHYYMAIAYKQAFDIDAAVQQYRKVLSLNLGFTREANQELELLDKIVRAQPGSLHGKQISLIPAITRGDMAAVLIEELHLAELYKRDSPQQYDTSFQSPDKPFVPPGEQKLNAPPATDISNHPLRSDIEEVLKLKVRGLEASPQYLFYPNQKITRAEYAVMLEDILIRVTQDRKLATRFVGEPSPWPDVREDVFYYNAARTLVSRNIMGVWNRVRGEFGPSQTVHGADALLGIRIFKDELQKYVRNPEG